MNSISERLERGLAAIIRRAEIGGETIIRCWHAVRDDYRWRPDEDTTMPCIDIRTSGLSMGTAYAATSGRIEAVIACATLAQDDRDHAQIAGMAAAVEGVIYGLRREAVAGIPGGVWDELREVVTFPGQYSLSAILQIEAGTPQGGDLLTKQIKIVFAVCVS